MDGISSLAAACSLEELEAQITALAGQLNAATPAGNMTLPRKRPKVLPAQARRPESAAADTI